MTKQNKQLDAYRARAAQHTKSMKERLANNQQPQPPAPDAPKVDPYRRLLNKIDADNADGKGGVK